MANVKISALPVGSAPSGTEIGPFVQGGTTVSLTANQIAALAAAPTAANPTATAGPAAVNGSSAHFMRADGAPAVQLGTAVVPGLLQGDGSTVTITAGVISVTTPAPTAANPTATAGPAAVNGSSANFMRADAAPAIQLGSAAVAGLLRGDGSTVTISAGVISVTTPAPSAANPTATAKDTAVNGSAATFMRSDAAPAIQKASNAQFGLVEVDGTTITAAAGVISVPAASASVQGGAAVDNITVKVTGSNPTKLAVIESVLSHPGMTSGRSYTGVGYSVAAQSSGASSLGVIYAIPFYNPKSQTYTRQGVYTNSNGHVRMGVYNNTNGQPSSLFVDNGALTLASAGETFLTGLSFTLGIGWYWLAMLFEQANTVQFLTHNYFSTWLTGQTNGSLTSSAEQNITGSQAYGALPGSFPTIVYNNADTPANWIGF